MPKPSNINFPLDTFLQRLSVEGIEVSLPQRLQLLEVLRRFGQEALDNPIQLKYKIAPIIAKNGPQQERIYTLYAEFIKTAGAYTPPPPPPHRPWWQRWPRWQLGLLALTLLLLPVVFLWSRLFPAAEEPPMQANFIAPREAIIGESVTVVNKTLNFDTAQTTFQWLLIDIERGEVEWDSVVNDMQLEIPIRAIGESPEKIIRLIAENVDKGEKVKHETRLRLICADLPAEATIDAPTQAKENVPLFFGITTDSVAGLRYNWDFGDGEKGQGARISHTYVQPGLYEVALRISRPDAEGYCEVRSAHQITIGGKAYLADIDLEEDINQDATSELNFYWMSWLLLGLLLSYALYHFWRWINQPPPERTQEEAKQELDARFAHADRGPYNIPFENEESAIQVEENLFRLADRLRQRQESGRMILDVPASVRQTIDQGGFPVLLEKRTTLPPEYLFLVDEQSEGSHQASLYQYLVQFLKDKDVYINAFWYNKTFTRFWNNDYPEGINLEQLRRLFAHHRLLVLGDGYGLMDPFGEELKVKEAYQDGFKDWASRLLLTPVPPSSWTYKEATIYQLFPVFDSDATGFAAAMQHLDTLAEEADDPSPRKSFSEWHEGQSQPPVQPDINHLDWKDAETYTEYLRDYPALYRWVCALAVYPTPNWQVTLAIGRAIGAPVNFDNLLLLSRIPWLQGQPPSPKLRQQLLDHLDPETERLARAAVKQALEAAAPKALGSHANLELQTNLAVQSFLLDPSNGEHRATIEQLQQHQLLGKKQLLDLNSAISRKTEGKVNKLEDYLPQLAGREIPAAKGSDLRFNKHFYLALGAGIWLLLLGGLMLLLNGTPTLHQWVKGTPANTQIETAKSPAQYAYFLKEETLLDSAAIYNNLGVATWQAGRDTTLAISHAQLEEAIDYFEKALQLRSPYLLAQHNLAKANYNETVLTYNDYLDNQDPQALLAAQEGFISAEKDTVIRQEALHGKGLCYHYQGNREQASDIYAQLESEGFFNKLTLTPNLKTFYGPFIPSGAGCAPVVAFSIDNEAICPGEVVTLTNYSGADQIFDYFLLDWGDGQRDSLSAFTSVQHNYTRGSRLTITLSGFMQCDSTGLVSSTVSQLINRLSVPKAEILADVTQGCPPLTLNFSSRNTPGYQYRWEVLRTNTNISTKQQSIQKNQVPPEQNTLYDNAEGTGNTFKWTFATDGTYQVKLFVTNDCGEDNTTLSIKVLSPSECTETIPQKGRDLANTLKDSLTHLQLDLVVKSWHLLDTTLLTQVRVELYELTAGGPQLVASKVNLLSNDVTFPVERGRKYSIRGFRPGFIGDDTVDLDLANPVFSSQRTATADLYLGQMLEVNTFEAGTLQALPGVTVELFDLSEGDPRLIHSSSNTIGNDFNYPLHLDRPYLVKASRQGYDTVIDTLKFGPDDAILGKGRLIFDVYLPRPFELVLYFDDDHPNPRTRLRRTNLEYIVTNNTYYEQKDHFIKSFTDIIESKNDSFIISRRFQDFFDRDVHQAPIRLIEFSDRLIAWLPNLAVGEKITLQLMGGTSPRYAFDYNDDLVARRIDCVKNHFERYKNGILKPYIASGKLVFNEINFGEEAYNPDSGNKIEKPTEEVSDMMEDLRASVYSLAACYRRHVRVRLVSK